MNENYNITFNYVKGTKTMNFQGNMSLKDMFNQYANSLKEYNLNLTNCVFLANGMKLMTDSNQSLSKTLHSQTTILVLDEDAIGTDESSNTSIMSSINKNQFKNMNLRGFENKNNNIEILEDMAKLGCITKKLIDNSMAIGANSFMSVEEAIQKGNQDSKLFALGIFGKYLQNLGIKTVIDRIPHTENEQNKNLSNVVLQFIFNGLIFKKKFYLYFNLSKAKINKLYESKKDQNNFKDNLIDAINDLYGIPQTDIIIAGPVHDKYYSLIVLFKDDNVSLTKDKLMSKFKTIPDLCELINVKKDNIIEGIILNKCMLDHNGDAKDGEWEYYSKRGGEDYLPPEGWDRYGLSVYNKYDNRNNDWLSSDNREGEWCIAYSWLTYDKNAVNLNQPYENFNDAKNDGKKVGKGIYCSQNPEIMEEFTPAINVGGNNFKLGLMLRVNPSKIRNPVGKEFWVVNGNSDEIRPYGILIQKEK